MLRNRPAPKLLSTAEEAGAYDAAQCVVETHRRLSAWLHLGLTLNEIDRFVAETLEQLDCRSCFLGYQIPEHPPFPSHACLSLNACVVHGHADETVVRPGDVLKIDIGVHHRGWIGDAARTYVFGEMTPELRKLTDCGKEALRRGITKLRPGNYLIDWAHTVQNYVEREQKFFLIDALGGHGYGRTMHESPYVANVVPARPRDWPEAATPCTPGMLLAVEPMIAVGTRQTVQTKGSWPVHSADGSQSVHYEHDVLITGRGPRVLTEGLEDVNDLITR